MGRNGCLLPPLAPLACEASSAPPPPAPPAPPAPALGEPPPLPPVGDAAGSPPAAPSMGAAPPPAAAAAAAAASSAAAASGLGLMLPVLRGRFGPERILGVYSMQGWPIRRQRWQGRCSVHETVGCVREGCREE
jgi:hypothetical protein